MKKNLFMVAAVALMAMVSCNKEEVNNEVVAPAETMEFTAYVDGAITKASFVTDDVTNGAETHWEATDVIYVNGEEFKVKDEETGLSVTFVGNKVEAPFRAVFAPARGTFANVEIPAEQKAVTGENAVDHIVSAAYAEAGSDLKFQNLTSLLMFEVPVACSTVTISSDDALAGTVSVNDELTVSEVTTTNTVTLTGSFAAGTKYYAAVLPGTKTNLTFATDGKEVGKIQSFTINASSVVDFGTLPTPVVKLYVEDDSDYSALYLYLFDSNGDNTWPGNEITDTETINGVEYKVFTVPKDKFGKTYTYIFNNNKGAQVEENKTITFNKNNYLRLTKKYTQVIDDTNKGADDPITLYIRNDDNWNKLNYYMWIPNGATNASWPGIAVPMNQKTQIENSIYYYVELGTHNYTRVIINNGTNQTSDLTVPSTTDDCYVTSSGYIWKGADQNI